MEYKSPFKNLNEYCERYERTDKKESKKFLDSVLFQAPMSGTLFYLYHKKW